MRARLKKNKQAAAKTCMVYAMHKTSLITFCKINYRSWRISLEIGLGYKRGKLRKRKEEYSVEI